MAAAASFSVSHENGQTILIDTQTPKTYIYTSFRGNSEKSFKKN